MTRKQQLFIDLYVKTRNATQSAIQAGYSQRIAGMIGYENLKKPYIKVEVDRRFKELHEKLDVNKDNIVKRLWEIVNKEDAKYTDKINAALGTAKVLGITKDTEISVNLKELFGELQRQRIQPIPDVVEQVEHKTPALIDNTSNNNKDKEL